MENVLVGILEKTITSIIVALLGILGGTGVVLWAKIKDKWSLTGACLAGLGFCVLIIWLFAGIFLIVKSQISSKGEIQTQASLGNPGYANDMVPFDYEEIIVTENKAVGLGEARLNRMGLANDKRYKAFINVQDATIAVLETGGEPTRDTKNVFHLGTTFVLDSFYEMKQFKAISTKGTAILAVHYYQGQVKR